MSYSAAGSHIVYTYTLAAGQTILPGSGWLFGPQFGSRGAAHTYSGDAYAVTATAGGATTTGHF